MVGPEPTVRVRRSSLKSSLKDESLTIHASGVCERTKVPEKELEAEALNFICHWPDSSNLELRYPGKDFFHEEFVLSVPLEDVLRFALTCERRKQVILE